jgi:hypothetical protein
MVVSPDAQDCPIRAGQGQRILLILAISRHDTPQ